MILAKLKVSGTRADAVEVRAIPKGMIGGQVEVEYEDPAWEGLTKTAVFQTRRVTRDVLNAEGVVTIPGEVVSRAGEVLRVGIYGVDAEGVLAVPTVWAELGQVQGAAEPSGDETTNANLPVWAQLQDQVADLREYGIGTAGPQGVPGKSAYQHAQEAGYLGSEEEFSIKLATDHIDWFGVGVAIPSGADLNKYKTKGKYYANTEAIGKSLLNRPEGMNTNFVMWVFQRTTSTIYSQLMLTLSGKLYIRSSNSSGWRSWNTYTTSEEVNVLTEEVKQALVDELRDHGAVPTVKNGLTVAIIGDSISTHPQKNVCEMVIEEADIGIRLSSYITHYDVGKTISLDGVSSGYTIGAGDVGRELVFMPCADDVHKTLGTPKNYNSITSVWWQVAADTLGFEPIAAAWSGSSITSHTAATDDKKASYAWHDHTIRKLGKRVPGSMNRVAPDVVLIYRGTNDLSHSTSVRLTGGYFDTVDWNYPYTDVLSGGATYGFKEGLALTVRKIRETYPRARIVLCTCNVFKRSKYTHFPTHNGNFSIPQMNNAIREVADFFGCHIIELDKCGITWENCYTEGYITDSSTKPTHPNAQGHALMAQQAISDLLHRVHIADVEPSFDLIEFAVGEGSGGEGEEAEPETNFASLGTLVENYYVNKNTGSLVASDQYFSYTEIPINSNAVYKAARARNVAFYGADGTRVGGAAMEGAAAAVISPSAGAVTMTVCYKYTDYPDPSAVVITEVLENTSGQSRIGDLYGTLMDNHYIETDTGMLSEYTGEVKYFAYTDIAVEASTTYRAPYARNTAFYDDDGIYIGHIAAGGASTATITTPAGAAYMAVTYQHKNFSDPSAVTITLA